MAGKGMETIADFEDMLRLLERHGMDLGSLLQAKRQLDAHRHKEDVALLLEVRRLRNREP
ncbi:MAG TPA: hypothetical protein VM695_01530 [Phycisphaerae bacterium]|nr:hypothetical protein [Phycisphaerae bacterium]